MTWSAFVGSCLLLAMIPGVSTAVILRQTFRFGRPSGVAALLGNETGIFLWAMAAVFGLSALVLASEVAYGAMKAVGAALLIVMGVQSLWKARHAPPAAEASVPPGGGWRRSYGMGLATCGANPKAAVFAMSFLPQFVPQGAHVPLTLTLLAVVWVVVDVAWYVGVIWLVGRAGAVLGRPAVRRRLEQVTGVVLVALGLRVAVEAR
ncbi:lysine transporter LysE [Microbispora rosea subsp. aerata]|nr:LysE family translocator [Microbispora rosea]GGO11179.1 lysine transporter LysE [Microbispora rosea subsp. aerata]GIH53565.1 lysine transporter LysE [Microbispora rosea subsp. aerata]GLJ86304.1 lysine transporter LysE [Microbispora rosea subsp. aerata]